MAIILNDGNQFKVTIDEGDKKGIFDDLFNEVENLNVSDDDKNRLGGKICVAAFKDVLDSQKKYKKGFEDGFNKGFLVGAGCVVVLGIGAGIVATKNVIEQKKRKKKTYTVYI